MENSALSNRSPACSNLWKKPQVSIRGVLLRDDPDDQTRVVKPLAKIQSRDARYQVMGEIARGGVGVVMKGRDTDLGRDVAMKTLRSEHRGKSPIVARFVEEAQIAGQLQ